MSHSQVREATRGNWVDDPIGRYFSDFDLLVIVSHEDLTDVLEFWAKTEGPALILNGEVRLVIVQNLRRP